MSIHVIIFFKKKNPPKVGYSCLSKKIKMNSYRKAHDISQQYDQIRRPARLTGKIKNTKKAHQLQKEELIFGLFRLSCTRSTQVRAGKVDSL